jgi:hypothetical protein
MRKESYFLGCLSCRRLRYSTAERLLRSSLVNGGRNAPDTSISPLPGVSLIESSFFI